MRVTCSCSSEGLCGDRQSSALPQVPSHLPRRPRCSECLFCRVGLRLKGPVHVDVPWRCTEHPSPQRAPYPQSAELSEHPLVLPPHPSSEESEVREVGLSRKQRQDPQGDLSGCHPAAWGSHSMGNTAQKVRVLGLLGMLPLLYPGHLPSSIWLPPGREVFLSKFWSCPSIQLPSQGQ